MPQTQKMMNAVNIFRKQLITNSYEDARHFLLRHLQHKTFPESIKKLVQGKELDKRDMLLPSIPSWTKKF